MLARLPATSLYRATSTSRKRPRASVMGVAIMLVLVESIVDIAAPARQTIAADLVTHGSQADAQQLGGAGTIAAGGFERDFNEFAFQLSQGNSGTNTRNFSRCYCHCLNPLRFVESAGTNFSSTGQRHHTAHAIRQFPDVARPRVL